MISVIFAAAVLFAQAEPAAASAANPPAAAPTPGAVSPVTVTGKKKTQADPNEVVCHSEPVLGTLFPKRVCATRQEIADRRNVDQASTRQSQALRPWKDPAS
jgi:hypothetical protein